MSTRFSSSTPSIKVTRMRAYLAFLLSWLVASSPAYGVAVYPGPSGTLATITSKGLLVGQNWVTNDRDNYVTNMGCFIGTTGITASGTAATITRNTTTPLGEVADCSVNLGTSASGYVEWAVRTIPSGIRDCALVVQAQTLSLGTASVEWQVVQAGIVVARVAAVATATALPVLLPVPCSTATTTIRVAHTAYTSGTTSMKVSGVKYGDARALSVLGDAANITAWTAYTPTISNFGTTTNVLFLWRRVGDSLEVQGSFLSGTSVASTASFSIPSGITVGSLIYTSAVGTWASSYVGTASPKGGVILAATGATSVNWAAVDQDQSASGLSARNASAFVASGDAVSLFFKVPITEWSGSASAITPSNQNVYGSAEWSTSTTTITNNTGSFATVNNAALSAPILLGQASATNASCGAANDLGLCFATLPAGTYSVIISADMYATYSATGTQCQWSIYDGTTNKGAGITRAGVSGSEDHISSLSATYSYSSPQTNISFRLQAYRGAGGGGDCNLISQNTTGRNPSVIVRRLDAQNSAVFVRSPVKAAGTGVAPITGEVNNVIPATLSVQTATRATAGSTTATIGTLAIPAAGCYEFVLQDNVVRNAFGGASSSSFGGLRILNSTDSLTIAEDPFALYMANVASDLESMFTVSVHLSAVRCYTSAKTIIAQLVNSWNGGSGTTVQNRATGIFYAKNTGDR